MLKKCDPTRRGWEWLHLNLRAESIRFVVKDANVVQFSPDGKLILTATGNEARLRNPENGAPVGEPMKHENQIKSAIFSPDGTRILTVSLGDGIVNGGTTVGAESGKNTRLWNAVTGKPVSQVTKHDNWVSYAVFSPDGTHILTSSGDNTARMWDAATGRPVGEVMKHGGSLTSAAFSPDGTRILTVSNEGIARLWDAATCEPVGEEITHGDWLCSAVFSPNGRSILSASSDGTARMWDAATGRPLGEARVPTREDLDDVTISSSPDGRFAALRSLGYSGTSTVYVVPEMLDSPEQILTGEDVDLEIAALMSDSPAARQTGPRAQASGSSAKSNQPVARAPGSDWGTFILTPDGTRRVAIVGNSVRFSQTPTHPSEPEAPAPGQSPTELEPVTHRGASSIRAPGLEGRDLAVFRLDKQPFGLAFSPDGTRLVVLLKNQSALVWDTRGREARQADRDARIAERKPAEEYVDALWARATPLDQLDSAIRADKSITPLRKLVALEKFRERIAEINGSVQQEFDRVIKECVTPSRVKEWVVRAGSASNESPPLARRIHEGVVKKLEDWKSDANQLNGIAWSIVESSGAKPDRIAQALEAAQGAVRLEPNQGNYLNTLGAAQYRNGAFDEALVTLHLSKKWNQGEQVADWAFIAMCQLKLNRREESLASMIQLQNHSDYQLDGRLDGRKFTFKIVDIEGEMGSGNGWVEIIPDGQTFVGLCKWDGDYLEWKWAGKRRTGRSPDRFDGHWSVSAQFPEDANALDSLWLTTAGDQVIGIGNPEGVVLEAVELYESTMAASATADQSATSQPASITTTQPTYEQSPASQPAGSQSIPPPTNQPS